MKSFRKLTALWMTFALALCLLTGTAVPASAEPAPAVSISPETTDSPNRQAFSVYVERDSIYEAYVY